MLVGQAQSQVLGVVSSGGQPLAGPVREDMESRLGQDFSGVRVHTDEAAHRSAVSVNAHAYTVGSKIAFRRGAYDPSTTGGKAMLVHELVHVIQQRSGATHGNSPSTGIRISEAGDPFEREAATVAQQTVADMPLEIPGAIDLHSGSAAEQQSRSHRRVGVPLNSSTVPHLHRQASAPSQPEFLKPGWLPVGKVGIVYKDEGVKLRDQPLPGEQSNWEILPQNTRVLIMRQNPEFGGWYAVRVIDGRSAGSFGYAVQSNVWDDLPDSDPRSSVFKVPGGGFGLENLVSMPGGPFAWYAIRTGDDARSLAMALYAANHSDDDGSADASDLPRGGVRINPDRFQDQDSFTERVKDLGDEYRRVTRRVYQSVELITDKYIWCPGPSYIAGMKSAGIIPTRPEWKNVAIEVGKGLAGFQAGLTSGFFGAIADALVGVYDLGKSVVDGIVKVFTGEALAMAEKLYDFLVELSESENKAERIKELATSVLNALVSGVASSIDEFLDRWGAANVFDKWHFRGNVVGTVAAEIMMAVVSGGAAAARLLVGKLGTLGAKLLRVVDKTAEAIDGILPPKKRHRDGTPDENTDNDLTGERGLALAKARIITEAADNADLPIPALLAKLKPLELHKGVSGFSAPASGPGQHLVLMRTIVKKGYTPHKSSEDEQKRPTSSPRSEAKLKEATKRSKNVSGIEHDITQKRAVIERDQEDARDTDAVFNRLRGQGTRGKIDKSLLSDKEQELLAQWAPDGDIENLTMVDVRNAQEHWLGQGRRDIEIASEALERQAENLLVAGKPVYDVLRLASPSVAAKSKIYARWGRNRDALTGRPPKSGAIDVDHVIPLEKLVSMPGFDALPPKLQLDLANDIENLIPMDATANRIRGARSWADWPDAIKSYDSSVIANMRAEEIRIQRYFAERIRKIRESR